MTIIKTIPACTQCKHYTKEMDFPVCTLHYIEEPDYISGNVYKVNRFAPDVRKNDKLCGPDAKDFIQKEQEEEQPKESRLSKLLKILF